MSFTRSLSFFFRTWPNHLNPLLTSNNNKIHLQHCATNLYIKVRSGNLWPPVKAAFCQPIGTYQRAATKRRVVLRRCLLFIILHHCRCFSDGRMVKWYFGNISHKQIKLIALSLFTRGRGVAHSTNYPGHGPGVRSLQWNAIRRATDQSSVHRVLFILQIALPKSLLTDS